MKKTKLFIALILIVFGVQLGESQVIVEEGFESDCDASSTSFYAGCHENWINISGSADSHFLNEPGYEGDKHAHLFVLKKPSCTGSSDLGEGIAYTYDFKEGCTYSLSFAIARSNVEKVQWVLADNLENTASPVGGICLQVIPSIASSDQILNGAIPGAYEDSEWIYVEDVMFTPEKDYSHLWFRPSNIDAENESYGRCFLDAVKIEVNMELPVINMDIPELVCAGDPIPVVDNSLNYTEYKFDICRIGPDDECLVPGGNPVSSGWIEGQIENLDLEQAYSEWSNWQMWCQTPIGPNARYKVNIYLRNRCNNYTYTTAQRKIVTVQCQPCDLSCHFDIVQFDCNELKAGSDNIEDTDACYACFRIVGNGVVPNCNLWYLSTDTNPIPQVIASSQTEVVISYADHPGASYYTLNVYQCTQVCDDNSEVETFYDLCGPKLKTGERGSLLAKISAPEFTFNVQPNPFTEFLEFEFSETNNDPVQVRLFDINGKLVLNTSVLSTENSKFVLETQDLPSGVYFLNLKCGEFNKTKKLIKVE